MAVLVPQSNAHARVSVSELAEAVDTDVSLLKHRDTSTMVFLRLYWGVSLGAALTISFRNGFTAWQTETTHSIQTKLVGAANNPTCHRKDGTPAQCGPGSEYCGPPFSIAPRYHLMDQRGCAENDPNGPFFDPVHGVVHHFYQDHLAVPPGHGPVYGHLVSRDFVHWASVPVAIWNGLDSSKKTNYDTVAIFTGSAVIVDGAGPDGFGPGVIQIFPGLCTLQSWPKCETGTVLAQAVPASYANDPLLLNWTKPSYNPIMENAERDPSTPWKTPSGEWRMRTYNSKVYGCLSDDDMVKGKWYEIGTSHDFRTCECPSIYPLPGPTPGFETDFEVASKSGLPDTVHKTSCEGDWWQLGTYLPGKPGVNGTVGTFKPTLGWEDLYTERRIDGGKFYASKDAQYPTLSGDKRRINWGWATVPPASAQTLPREITFNPAVRSLQQYPIEELVGLRSTELGGAVSFSARVDGEVEVKVANHKFPAQGEIVVMVTLPEEDVTVSVAIGKRKAAGNVNLEEDSFLFCNLTYSHPAAGSATAEYDRWNFYEVPVSCGLTIDTLRLLPTESTVEIRLFVDWTFVEAYFARGRVSITEVPPAPFGSESTLFITSTAAVEVEVEAYVLDTIWVEPEVVRDSKRAYPSLSEGSFR